MQLKMQNTRKIPTDPAIGRQSVFNLRILTIQLTLQLLFQFRASHLFLLRAYPLAPHFTSRHIPIAEKSSGREIFYLPGFADFCQVQRPARF